ncbi:hypothetical protein HOD20_03185 [archaeon]|mgnify:FL=1|jgi:hypothetical protein|nr:hypothetical protein [archaeon]MBT4351507.1 hypothetical protein [archaeon]MBT4648628.1 hypothetical protein [archaeon]MBT6822493.1 hypothetical protein [archaeon]MBT7392167.1 hypothetical protein [archaeon]
MVELKIDTKKDSVQDIKKAIEFLKKFIDEEVSSSTIPNDFATPSVSSMNIFGNDETKPTMNNNQNDEPEQIDITDVKIEPY